jgi:hypothetical protein
MTIRAMAALVATVALARVAPAQTVAQILEDDFRNAGKDILAIWGAPFDGSSRDWMLAAASFGAFGLSMAADKDVSDWAIQNQDAALFRAIKPLRRGGVLFSGKYVVPPIAALYIVGVATNNQDLRDFVLGCMSTWGGESPARRGVAFLFGRARPDSFPDNPHHWKLGGGYDNWMMRSFPAGHFANVMGCATFWNRRFRLGALEPLIYGIAGGVGIGRLADEAHWFSDTVIGGILGYAVGREVAHRSLKRQAMQGGAGGLSTSSLYLSPDMGTGGMTVGMRWTF